MSYYWSILNFCKKRWRGVLVALVSIGFLLGTAFFNIHVQDPGFIKWGSPDENANYVFAKLYGQTGEMTIFEKYNVFVEDIIHPRSIRSTHGILKPMSFLGIIFIFGQIVSFTTYKILPFLTPIFASVAIIFFYLLMKKIFGKRNALISTILLATFPAFIYYTARSMFHNVLFVSLLVIGVYFAYIMTRENKWKPKFFTFRLSYINKKSWIYACLAGGFLGLAVATRTSELLWIIPGGLVLWLFNIRKVGITKLILFLASLWIALLPVLHWNQILYGAPLHGGYPEMNNSIESLKDTSGDLVTSTVQANMSTVTSLVAKAKNVLFYFGFNPDLAERMFVHYVVEMFPWLFWPAILGVFLFLQGASTWKKKHWAYLTTYIIISLILIYYYGSWKFHDNPDKASFTIGNSYTRYWLPVYMGALPFVSIVIGKFPAQIFSRNRSRLSVTLPNQDNFFKRFSRKFETRKLLAGIISLLLLIFLGYNMVYHVLYGSEEGLVYAVEDRRSMEYQYEQILDATPGDAVIITKYHDKLLFPQRKVVVGLFRDPNMIQNYARVAEYLPLYYYNFTLSPEAVEYLNKNKLKAADLRMEEYKHINHTFTLYKLEKRMKP